MTVALAVEDIVVQEGQRRSGSRRRPASTRRSCGPRATSASSSTASRRVPARREDRLVHGQAERSSSTTSVACAAPIKTPSPIEFPNLTFYVPEADAQPFIDHANDRPRSRTARTRPSCTARSRRSTTSTRTLFALDVPRRRHRRGDARQARDSTTEEIKLVKVELYTEAMTFTYDQSRVGTGVARRSLVAQRVPALDRLGLRRVEQLGDRLELVGIVHEANASTGVSTNASTSSALSRVRLIAAAVSVSPTAAPSHSRDRRGKFLRASGAARMARSKVAVIRVRPDHVLDDIDRLHELAGVERALAHGRPDDPQGQHLVALPVPRREHDAVAARGHGAQRCARAATPISSACRTRPSSPTRSRARTSTATCRSSSATTSRSATTSSPRT